jgi:hypothetical protein
MISSVAGNLYSQSKAFSIVSSVLVALLHDDFVGQR